MGLDFPNGHSTGVERQYLVVKTGPARLVFGNQLRFESAVAITWNFNRQLRISRNVTGDFAAS